MEKDGAFYLFTLRLVPLFPFFVINLVMGLTPIRTGLFYLVSQIGMLPGTAVYVNAGTQLAGIESAGDILSAPIVLSFALLGIFPLVARRALAVVRAKKVYAPYARPKSFDYNLLVMGAGSAGLVSAYMAAAVKAKVALVEKHRMGGDCLNTGCVPSKAIIQSAKIIHQARRAKEFGVDAGAVKVDFARVMERVRGVIQKVAPHDSVERYTSLGVDCIQGEARLVSPFSVEVDGRTITAKTLVIAAGASPFVPPLPGLEKSGYLTSDTVWGLKELPERFFVLGGGPVGCELAQAFARLGSKVTLVQRGPRLLPKEDEDVSLLIREKFEAENIRVLTEHEALEVQICNGRKALVCRRHDRTLEMAFDEILVALGRAANTRGYGLKKLGIAIRKNGTIETDDYLRTRYPNIYCAGDVTGPYQFTHAASHQAWYAAINALFSPFKSFRADYRVIPRTTFTDPEVAQVGLNLAEAKKKGVEVESTQYDLADLDRAITDSQDRGFIRVLTKPGSDRIYGATIVSAHAGEMLQELVLAMKSGMGLNKILGTIHAYPTFGEAVRAVAGQWKKAHAPDRALAFLRRFHAWRRG